MSFRAIYSCDICREDTLKANLMGCNFSGMRTFKLDVGESTQGVHICIACLDQLRAQLSPKQTRPRGRYCSKHPAAEIAEGEFCPSCDMQIGGYSLPTFLKPEKCPDCGMAPAVDGMFHKHGCPQL